MRADIVHSGAVALLFACLAFFDANPAQALPPNHPDKCPDTMPSGSYDCLRGGGKLYCTNDGDVLCCKPNTGGGQDCDQVEAFKNPNVGVGGRIPGGGQLQVAPVNPAPKTFMNPKAGMNERIIRRGIEGESATSAPTGQETTPTPK